MQIVITPDNVILATHMDEQDLTGKYPGLRVLTVQGYWEAGQQLTPEEAEFPVETATVTNKETITTQAEQALVALRSYRDLESPTNAQTVMIVKTLCRVAIALIRLNLRKLDSTD